MIRADEPDEAESGGALCGAAEGESACPYRVVAARSITELEDAARVRWAVFSQAMRQPPGWMPAAREVNGFDLLETTLNLVCYRGGLPVGTIRLVRPNRDVAALHGIELGIPLEIPFRVEGLPEGACVAELGRAAVLPAHRGTSAIGKLYRAAYEASLGEGISHWLGVLRTETDDLGDARLIAAALHARGRDAPDPWLRPRIAAMPRTRAARPLYAPEERRRAEEGGLDALRLPESLRFALGLGLRVAGEPLFDSAFQEWVLGALLPLDAFAESVIGRRFVAVGRGRCLNRSGGVPLPAA